jgi:hypothetical protein
LHMIQFLWKNCIFLKKIGIVLENTCADFPLHFFGIYNNFVKFLKDLANISITVNILIDEN